jgi:hypothetical protein
MSKIDTLNEYIDKCDGILQMRNKEYSRDSINGYARILQEEIIGVYSDEIKNITYQLDSYAPHSSVNGVTTSTVDYISDSIILKAKLINYRDNLELELSKGAVKRAGQTININQNNTNSANASSYISFEQVVKDISEINDSILSEEEKELLQGKLLSVENLKKSGADKYKVWEKAKSVIGWILDKSVDVGITALPYIIQAIK